MSEISPPRTPISMDRLLECEEAIKEELQNLVWRAVKAGWDEIEVCTAIATLADHHILAVMENRMTETDLTWARKKP
ncbi:hypothetical protein GGQ64_002557 [Rhizobium azooxidifex]|uniref:Uncharacterized protein n=1 Tax=Mycoplana azooxidifex TaxID=1636188 RepID=A0A7W6D9W6_9HYPH|nr:hypothetical protein [Mycoplana azooxidifex]MBB3977351.1 hypothetical protein [Mycoplana azooxidifex]